MKKEIFICDECNQTIDMESEYLLLEGTTTIYKKIMPSGATDFELGSRENHLHFCNNACLYDYITRNINKVK